MDNNIKVPAVHELASAMALGKSPVELYEGHCAAIAGQLVLVSSPAPDIKPIQAELRARIQFAWQLARAKAIETGGRRPQKPAAGEGTN
jgi:hypothetical protein